MTVYATIHACVDDFIADEKKGDLFTRLNKFFTRRDRTEHLIGNLSGFLDQNTKCVRTSPSSNHGTHSIDRYSVNTTGEMLMVHKHHDLSTLDKRGHDTIELTDLNQDKKLSLSCNFWGGLVVKEENIDPETHATLIEDFVLDVRLATENDKPRNGAPIVCPKPKDYKGLA